MVTSRRVLLSAPLLLALALCACDSTEADARFEAGLVPGSATLPSGVAVAISPGRAHATSDTVVARAASPTPELTLSASTAGQARFQLTNVDPASSLSPPPASRRTLGPTTVELVYDVPVEGLRIRVAPQAGTGPARFAVISDIHNNLATFGRFAQDVQTWRPDLVLCMGDLTKHGGREEFDEIFGHLADPGVPFYTTLGNHELMGEAAERFAEEIGPGSVAFDVRGVRIVLADTANAAFAPAAYPWLAQALSPRASAPALVLAHIPPLEPWGTRDHGFSNRDDGLHFVQALAEGDTTHFFAGHIHSWADYSIGGVPATISGGGGGATEVPGGPGHHWMKLEVDPFASTPVSMTRVDLD